MSLENVKLNIFETLADWGEDTKFELNNMKEKLEEVQRIFNLLKNKLIKLERIVWEQRAKPSAFTESRKTESEILRPSQGRRTENREQRTENREQRTENREQRTEKSPVGT